MEQKLKEIMGDLFEMNVDDVTDLLTMKDFDVWDSLRHMELVVSIEQEFGIDLTSDDIVAMLTFREITQVLNQKGITD